MGTEKRERQKANRQLKLEEIARDSRKQKTKRRALQFGLGIPALVALAFLVANFFGDDSGSDGVSGATTPVSDLSASTVATADPGSSTTVAGDTGAVTTTIGTPPSTIAGGAYPCPPSDGSADRVVEFPAAPPMCIDVSKKYTATVQTNFGAYTMELDPSVAPLAVNSFVYLAGYHFFDNTPCHRIIPGFVVQCGSPDGSGNGGPGYSFADELPATSSYAPGTVAMANSGPDTNGSQFFVVSGEGAASLPANYTIFGKVTDGMDTIAALDAVGSTSGTPASSVNILGVTVKES